MKTKQQGVLRTGIALLLVVCLLSTTGVGQVLAVPVQAAQKQSSGFLRTVQNWFETLATGAGTVASGYSGDTSWRLDSDGVLTFTGNGSMKNYTYKSEMPWYPYRDQIVSVVLKTGVTTVGNYAFYGMPALEEITIPSTVTTIGNYTFKGSEKLDKVALPNGLTKLGESAFYGCTSLSSIEIPASLWTIQPYTFKNCTNLKTLKLNEGNLMKISDGAFYGAGLTELTVPKCVSIVDVYTFKNCANLASITFAGSIAQIREASFYGTAIREITIPEGVTSIGSYAFKNCTNLRNVNLPSTLTNVDEASFYACTALESLNLPDKVTTIGNYAFRKCIALKSVQFSAELTNIGESSFYGCEGLTTLTIPSEVTAIQGYAFKGCINLTNVKLSDSVTTLGESAFYGCTGLTSFTIPASVTKIGDYCFSRSIGIQTVTFEGDAPAVGSSAFAKVVADVYYPANNTWTASKLQNYGGTLNWRKLETYTVTFINYDGTTLVTRNVPRGGDAQPPEAPNKDNANFLGWCGTYTKIYQNETVKAVYSDEPNVFVIESVSSNPGGTATVLVSVDGVVKTCGFEIILHYDPALELVSYNQDLDLDLILNDAYADHAIYINYMSSTDKTKERDIIELTFKLSNTAKGLLPIETEVINIMEIREPQISHADYIVVTGVVVVN